MPLPESQQRFLRRHLQVHEDRLDALRSQQEHIACEVRTHELVLTLGRDERLLEALCEIAEDSEAASRACTDALAHFRERGVSLPEGLEVYADRDEYEVVVHATYLDDFYPFELSWAWEDGFSARPLEAPGKTGA